MVIILSYSMKETVAIIFFGIRFLQTLLIIPYFLLNLGPVQTYSVSFENANFFFLFFFWNAHLPVSITSKQDTRFGITRCLSQSGKPVKLKGKTDTCFDVRRC